MIRDQETINALVDIIERFVRERLIPAEDQMAEEIQTRHLDALKRIFKSHKL